MRGWVVERPGLHLAPDALQKLREELVQIAEKTLSGDDLDYGVFDEDSGAMDRSLITVLYDSRSGAPLAFNSMPILDVEIAGAPEEVLHLGLVMVDPDARSGGLSSLLYGFACALALIRRQFRPIWISSVTQVPAVVGLVSQLYTGTYPSPEPEARRTFTHLQIARRIMRDHRSAFGVGEEAGFDEQTFVISNAYTGGSDELKKTFDEAPKHREAKYNEMCANGLDYDRGDDFLQIGQLDPAALRHYLLRTLPENSVAGAMTGLGFFWLQSIFLPVIQWFDSRQPWEGLRPWNR